MSERVRKVLRIAGMALVAAALGVIGYASYRLFDANAQPGVSLSKAEQEFLDAENALIGDTAGGTANPDEIRQILDDMNAYTGNPPETAGPTGDRGGGADPDGSAGATPKPGGNSRIRKTNYFAILVFDSLGNRKVAVLEGASESTLGRGAMHHERSSPAGATGNCVIFGHRDTVFSGFGRLKTGDTVRLRVPGNTYVYRITAMKVVQPDDPAIFKAYDARVMTLVTCYPFSYVGSAPQRYIVVCTMDEPEKQ